MQGEDAAIRCEINIEVNAANMTKVNHAPNRARMRQRYAASCTRREGDTFAADINSEQIQTNTQLGHMQAFCGCVTSVALRFMNSTCGGEERRAVCREHNSTCNMHASQLSLKTHAASHFLPNNVSFIQKRFINQAYCPPMN